MLRQDLVDVGAGSKGTVVVAERFIISQLLLSTIKLKLTLKSWMLALL